MSKFEEATASVYAPFSFLIVGSGRSGTSLVAGLLDHHTRLTVEQELGGRNYLRGKGIPERPQSIYEDRAEGFLQRCLRVSRSASTPQWGNKITTEQVTGLNRHNMFNTPAIDVMDKFFNQLLAPLKIVYVLRDGRACIESKLRRTEQSMESACKHWRDAIKILVLLQQRENVHVVRYEELVTAPVYQLQQICDFLNIEFEPDMLAGSNNVKIREQYRNPVIESQRALAVDLQHSCTEFISQELEYCGYPL